MNLRIFTRAFLILAVFALQFGLSEVPQIPIYNVHESIDQSEDLETLTRVMSSVGMTNVVLHGIPSDFLYFKADDGDLNLSEVGNNHEVIMAASQSFPETVDFFCNIDPGDPEREEVFEDCLKGGALGVKFYVGYSYAHTYDLDDPNLDTFYNQMLENEMILMLPVNTDLYQDQLENLLLSYPDLKLVCPHYCLSSKSLDRVDGLLDTYDNLYVDTSFGHLEFVREGLSTMSANHEAYEKFFTEHQDRILFATDSVVAAYEGKDEAWVKDLYKDYIAILTEDEFESHLEDGSSYHGLGLPYGIQEKVFWKNWESLLK